MITFETSETIIKILDVNTGGSLVKLLDSTIPTYSGNGILLKCVRFIEGLTATARLFSLPITPLPDVDLTDTEYAIANKVLESIWTSPRRQLQILLTSDDRDDDSYFIRSEEALTRDYAASKDFSLQEIFTDKNSSLKLGTNGNIGFKIAMIDNTFLGVDDSIIISCQLTERYIIDDSPQNINTSVPFGLIVSNLSNIIVPANSKRKIVTLTNTSDISDCYINLGSTAFRSQGICLKANGGTFILDTNTTPYYGSISAISNTEDGILVTGLEGM